MNLKRLLRSLATALAGTLVVFAIVIGAGLMLSGSSPDLSYRTLDYDVAVQADGSLKVTQHIDMKLRTRDGDTPWRAAVPEVHAARGRPDQHHRHQRAQRHRRRKL